MDKKTPPQLSALPVEVLDMIASNLENGDIKNLRLTSTLGFAIRLHIKRVYLSANPLNIKMLETIADSELHRYGVRELIWDDSYLCNPNDLVPVNPKKNQTKYDSGFDQKRRCPKSYVKDSHLHLQSSNYRGGNLVLPDLMQQETSWEDSYAYYCDLVQQQRTVISSNADVQAFSYALAHFPYLSKITISSKAHGRLFVPFYHTPMIRACPAGFIYPGSVEVHQGQKAQFLWEGEMDAHKKKHTIQRRGLSAALRMLAKHGDHQISEFFIEDYQTDNRDWVPLDLRTPGHTRDDLATLLKRPDFHTLTFKVDIQNDRWNSMKVSEVLGDMRKLFCPIFGLTRTWSFHSLTDDRKKNIRWTCSQTPGPDEHARCGMNRY
ncbi:hypothetical protein ACHAP5_001042 [Fusarium lateritium]